MAQTRNTKGSRSRSTAARGGGRRAPAGKASTRRAKRRAERSHLIGSLALLGAGLVVIAMVLVKGQNGWLMVRGWLFGLFGIVTYALGPLLLYLAYLVASGYLVGLFSAKVGLMAMLCATVPVVFSTFSVQDLTLPQVITELFAWSQSHYWSGGVFGGIIGGPLLAFCGRPVANILMVLVFLLGLMVFFAVTPVDVVQFLAYYWQRLRQGYAARQERRAQAEADAAAYADDPAAEPLETPVEPAPAQARRPLIPNPFAVPAAPAPGTAPVMPEEPPAPPVPAAPPARAEFDVDLGPDLEAQTLQNAVAHDPLEPVVIGPGGTFGLDPLKNLGDEYRKKRDKAAPAAPDTTEFDQHLDPQPASDEEGGEDALDELIQRAMANAAPGDPVAETKIELPIADDDFDTALEPVADGGTGITPRAAFPAAPAAVDDGGVGITPASAFAGAAPAPAGVPTLGGSFDTARAAWDAGVPVADALAGLAAVSPADAEEELPELPAEHRTAAAMRYRAVHAPADSAAPDTQPTPAGPAAEAEADPPAAPAKALAPAPAPEPPKPYAYPSLDLFNATRPEDEAGAEREMRHNADVLVNTLDSFGVKTKILDICRGPSVTRYELQPQAGIKVSRITSLADDIALNLATAGVRIEAPIPGKPAVGIEVPNKLRSTVNIRNVFESQNYINMRSPLTMALGKDIAGIAQVADLCRMPHLLIAGSTGSGKSVCVNSIIISFLFRSSPEDVKLILIDPKVVELAEYNGIPHLLMPVVTEPRKAAGALGASVAEMERRYKLFADNNVREIKAYNKLAQNDPTLEHLPYIAIVIDELADLMMVAGKEVEDSICRIAQKARAAGIHLIVATQRPSVDVITGLIKANIPSRIAFAVSSQIDSRTILDTAGAEKLLGNGDMLFLPVGAAKPTRVQGTFVTDEEIAAVLGFIKSTSDAQYDEEMIAEMERRAVAEKGAKKDADADDAGGALDPMFEQAVECVIEAGQASTSLLQRRCKLGYARAARIMDQMEQEKVIGPYEGAKPRSVLVTLAQWQERKLSAGSDG